MNDADDDVIKRKNTFVILFLCGTYLIKRC